MARIDRPALRTYLALARAAYWESTEQFELTATSAKDHEAAGIAASLAALVSDAAEIVADLAWSSIPPRFLLKSDKLNGIEARIHTDLPSKIQESVERARPFSL
jgi:hypothetical protein